MLIKICTVVKEDKEEHSAHKSVTLLKRPNKEMKHLCDTNHGKNFKLFNLKTDRLYNEVQMRTIKVVPKAKIPF